jgi:hypothetical protein
LAPLIAAVCGGAAHADELPAAPEARPAESWRLSLGGTYSSGRYGSTATTRVATAPLVLRYNRARFSLRVSVPFVHVTGPGSLVDTPQGSGGDASGGDDGASGGVGAEAPELDDGGSSGGTTCTPTAEEPCPPPGGDIPASNRAARNGIGDVAVTAGYGIDIGRIAVLDVAARVKLPTASRAKGIGTGKTDVTLSGTLTHEFGTASVWAGARRRLAGKVPGLVLRDVWGLSGGASLEAAPGVTLGADFDWQQSALRHRPLTELTGWTSVRLSPRLRLNAYAGAGLSSRSAGFLGGLSLAWRLD